MSVEKWTAQRIKALKGQAKLVCLTAYDFGSGRAVDAAGVNAVGVARRGVFTNCHHAAEQLLRPAEAGTPTPRSCSKPLVYRLQGLFI